MTNSTALNRFWILLLLLSFLLLNLTLLASFFASGDTVSLGNTSTHDSGSSINLSFRSSLDYLDAESITPRFCANRVVTLKKTSDERYQAVYSFPSDGGSDAHYRTFCLVPPSGQTSPAKICEFMHSKDGML